MFSSIRGSLGPVDRVPHSFVAYLAQQYSEIEGDNLRR